MFVRSAAHPRSLLLSFLVTIIAAGVSQAQSADRVHVVPKVNSSATSTEGLTTGPLRVDVDLVLVPVTVTDSLNHPVLSLQRNDFALYEGRTRQNIQYFSHEDGPISVGLVLDCSASMKNKIEYEALALEQFFANANPQDEYFAVAVSNKPHLIATAADSAETLQERLSSYAPTGRTALFDAIYLALSKLRTARYQRKALLIISDGGDNTSRYTRREVKKAIEEADVLTYAIGIFDEEPIPLLKTLEARMGRDWLSDLTDASGGRTIAADDRRQIPEIAAVISRELRSQYVLGYRSTNAAHDGRWRKLTVRLAQPSTTIRLQPYYKSGYRPPEP